jgi:DNA polymerase, archaea type
MSAVDPRAHQVERNFLLYGVDDTERVVSVEPAGGSAVRRYVRDTDGVLKTETIRTIPWLVTTESGARECSRPESTRRLHGDLVLDVRVEFSAWRDFRASADLLRERHLPAFALQSPVEQYLTASGCTLFKGMEYHQLRRLQLDIETTSLDPSDPEAEILVVALRTSNGEEELLHQGDFDEAELLSRLSQRIVEIDPDVIEGHNLFNFDVPYLMRRAQRHGVSLEWGRNGSTPVSGRTRRLRAGARSIPFQNVHVYGRHLIDTYHQIQRYDATGELLSYGLKESVEALGLERSNRVFVPGDQIASVWQSDPETILAYALDDVRDVALLSELAAPTDFYQTQMLPRTFQNVAIGGTGEKINALLVRAYLSEDHSLPTPEPPRDYPGGLTELRDIGVFQPVVKCDVESLYPAIMLVDDIAPSRDQLDTYPRLLSVLTERRFEAKRMARVTSGAEQARLNGLQSSFKVLINSFYGYLGYGRALFNDFAAAERVTRRGQELILNVVDELERRGAIPIEIDTDGVYFKPPESVREEHEEEEFVAQVGSALPAGINLAHDGSYQGMISLRTKNYVLLTRDGRLLMKGSSLRSRRDEGVLRRFLREAARVFILESPDAAREKYLRIATEIIERRLGPDEVYRTESITDKTYSSSSNRRLAEAVSGTAVGERVQVYERQDGQLVPMAQYASDEDRDYLLRRLRDCAQRFRPLFQSDLEFDYHFPPLTSASDVERVRKTLPASQLSMFPE